MNQGQLKELLEYNPETGIFIWTHDCKYGNYNRGDEAGTLHKSGYWRISIKSKFYKRSRLAWLYMKGYWPENLVDHRDQIKANDWFDNLREASLPCNVHNRPLQVNNTSGIKGVCWVKSHKRWVAAIYVNGKRKALGSFFNKLAAAKARYKAEIKYKYIKCDDNSSALRYINSIMEVLPC